MYRILIAIGLVVTCCNFASSTVIYNNEISQIPATFGGLSSRPFIQEIKRACPLCDSSVYPYCSEKLFHDSCCCYTPHSPYDHLPYECQYADCSFLHANTCREHLLISQCCCTNYFIKK